MSQPATTKVFHPPHDAQASGAQGADGATWVLAAVDGLLLRRGDRRAGARRLEHHRLHRPTETSRGPDGGDDHRWQVFREIVSCAAERRGEEGLRAHESGSRPAVGRLAEESLIDEWTIGERQRPVKANP